MHSSSWKKYHELRLQVTNWPLYFYFKFFGKGTAATFRLRKSSQRVSVPFAMLRVFKEIFMQDEYDLQFVSKHLLPHSVVLDVGANIGLFSCWISNHFPQHSVLAFEPFAGNHEPLIANLSYAQDKGGNITLYKKAVTGTPTATVDFYVDLAQPLSDSASCIPGFFNNQHKVTVPAVALQQVISQCPQRIGLLKLDCEGSEYDILYQSPSSIFAQVDAMIIETHDLDDAAKNMGGVLQLLETLGFQCRHKRVDQGLHLIWAYNRMIFKA